MASRNEGNHNENKRPETSEKGGGNEHPKSTLSRHWEELKSHGAKIWRIGGGLLYIYRWNVAFLFRERFTRLIPSLVFVATTLEVAGAISHVVKPILDGGTDSDNGITATKVASSHAGGIHLTPGIELVIAVILLFCVVILLWRHHRLETLVGRYQGVLSILAVSLERAALLEFKAVDSQERVESARRFFISSATAMLEALTKSNRRQVKLGARIWVQPRNGALIEIWDELNPLCRSRSFGGDVGGLVMRCLERKQNAVVHYLPKASVEHGFTIEEETERNHPLKHYRTIHPQWGVHYWPAEITQGSVICVRIPIEPRGPGRRALGEACLCLEADRTDCFRNMDYFVAQVYAGLIGSVLTRL